MLSSSSCLPSILTPFFSSSFGMWRDVFFLNSIWISFPVNREEYIPLSRLRAAMVRGYCTATSKLNLDESKYLMWPRSYCTTHHDSHEIHLQVFFSSLPRDTNAYRTTTKGFVTSSVRRLLGYRVCNSVIIICRAHIF